MVKSDKKSPKKRKLRIGILGGTFDPPHKGHLKISIEAKKKFKLDKVVWIITKKNPFKGKSFINLKKRIFLSKKMVINQKFMKVMYLENKIKSNKTISLLKHLKKKNSGISLFFIMGADNLINFHKWEKWRIISDMCQILVFDRSKYKAKSKKSLAYKTLKKRGLRYIDFKKVDISSSKIRKI